MEYFKEYHEDEYDDGEDEEINYIRELFEKKERIKYVLLNIRLRRLLIGVVSTVFGSGLVYVLYKRKRKC